MFYDANDFGPGGVGYGTATAQDLEDLHKALTAGFDNPPGTGGGALRVESLEQTLKILTFQERHVVFWRDLNKIPAYNTVEEYNQLLEYGNVGTGNFVPEGTLPETDDTSYQRRTVLVKYLGTTREVTHQMTLVRPAHGDVIALETLNGTRHLLRKTEEGLFNARADTITDAWDGLNKQLYDGYGETLGNAATDPAIDGNIIDLRGQPLDEKILQEGGRIIIDNFGFPTDLYLSYTTMQDLNALFFPKERLQMSQQAMLQGNAGFSLQSFTVPGGTFNLKPDVFIKPGSAPPTAATSTSAPSAPTLGTELSPADALSLLPAAVYSWAVTAFNRFGESVIAQTADITVAGGDAASFIITDTDVGVTTGYRIYRVLGASGASTATRFIAEIPVSGATDTFTDRNFDMPATASAWLVENTLDVMSFKQLAPFTKIPLATVAPSIRWMQLLYGTPVLYAPRKNVIFKNIGAAT